jgi:hypothetical protein
MKALLFSVFAFCSLNVNAADCAATIEEFFTNGDQLQSYEVDSVDFVRNLEDGSALYTVRTNFYGGESGWEVTTNQLCDVIDLYVVWTD